MKMTRREVVTHLEYPITATVRRDSAPHIDHSWVSVNTGLMTTGTECHRHLHKVLRHQSAHRSACPGNVSKWSASIGMTYSDLGYWLLWGCFFHFRRCDQSGGKQTPPTAAGAERKRFQSSNKASLLMFYFWLSAWHIPFEKSVSFVSTSAQFPEE